MGNQLEGRTVFLTGAGGLLGSTYVRRMLEDGASVAASDMPGERAEKLVSLHRDNPRFKFYDLNVDDERQVETIFARMDKDGISPNVVINNAAITGEMLTGRGESVPDFAETSLEAWERTLRTNLTGAFLIARQMDRDIVGKHPATLINVASMYALNGPHHAIYDGMGFKSFAGYSATKAGIHGLTLWLAGNWAPRNATVNTIAPGAVFNEHSREFQRRVSELIMAGRMARPDEIADVMLFLCSEKSSYMTGQIVNVDGGFSSW